MGHLGRVDRADHCATKHGLEGMVKGMTIEWVQLGIRVNTPCPTFAHAPLVEETLPNPDRLA